MELMTLNPGTGNCGDHMVMAVAGDHELSIGDDHDYPDFVFCGG